MSLTVISYAETIRPLVGLYYKPEGAGATAYAIVGVATWRNLNKFQDGLNYLVPVMLQDLNRSSNHTVGWEDDLLDAMPDEVILDLDLYGQLEKLPNAQHVIQDASGKWVLA